MSKFKRNKYRTLYIKIIQNARQRIIEGYCETHHFFPRSFGGDDRSSNLVELTAREHFIVHWLLTKFTTKEYSSLAFKALGTFYMGTTAKERLSSRQIAISREARLIAQRKPITFAGITYPSIQDAKNATGHDYNTLMRKIAKDNGTWVVFPRDNSLYRGANNGMFGRTHSEETKAKWSADRKGKYVGKDNPMYGKTHSEEAREKIRQARLGTTQTEESNQKRREACLKAVADGRIKYNPKAAQARRKPVIINGITYGSREEAKKALGVSHTQFFRMIKDGRLKITDAIETKQNPLPNVYGEEVW